MTPLALTPDVEGLVGSYLREHPDLVALDVRVAVQTPAKFDRPWVRMTLFDGRDRSHGQDWLIDSLVQFDCYAGRDGGSVESSLVARTVRAALKALPDDPPAGVTVSDVRVVGGPSFRPDTDLEPARARHVLSVEIDMHPEPGGS